MGRTLLTITGAMLLCSLAACDGDEPVTGDSEDVTVAGATRIASSLEGPGNLAVVGDQLVFSTAHFDASGDPELDQEFASWRGALYVKPLHGGQKKKVADTAGAVTSTAVSGSALLVVDSTYFGVTRFAMPGAKESDFYNDFSHFPDEGEDSSTLGAVAVGKSGVYISRPGSEIMSMKTDGSSVKTFAKTFKSGFIEMAEKIVVLDDAVFWSAQKEGETGSVYNLYRASVSGSTHTPKKIATYETAIRALATDGHVVFVAVENPNGKKGEIDVVAGDGATKPKPLVVDQSHADNLVYDSRFGLFFTEWDHGVMLVGTDAIAAQKPASADVVYKIKAPSSIAISEDDLFIASDPGEINEKKGSIWRFPLSKID